MCPAKRLLDYGVVEKNGYTGLTGVLAGNVVNNSHVRSWQGNASLQWDELMNQFLLPIHQSFSLWVVDHGQWKLKMRYDNKTSVDINLWPFLKCKEIHEFGQRFGIASKQGIQVLIADPVFQPTYRQVSGDISGDLMVMGNTGDSWKELVKFNVKTTILKTRLDKSSCKNYENKNDYTSCL